MKHQIFGRRLSRDLSARKALIKNLANSLLISGAITTTDTRAKFVQGFVERLVTDAKNNKLVSKRQLASILTKPAFLKLTDEIAPGFAKRNGGYTRIIKFGKRRGDGALMARLELLHSEKAKKAIAESTENEEKVQGKKVITKSSVSAKPSVPSVITKQKNLQKLNHGKH